MSTKAGARAPRRRATRRSRASASSWHGRLIAALTEPAGAQRWVVGLMALCILALCAYLVFSQRRPGNHEPLGTVEALPGSLPIIAGLSGGEVVDGNAATIAENGAFFESLERDVDAARLHVHVEVYIWGQGAVASRLGDALLRARQRGVAVRLLIDALGSVKADGEQLDRLREAGVEVVTYRPPGLTHAHSQNYRNHRKLAVVDGAVAWVMGHGIADEWSGDGQDEMHWRDTAIRLTGPIATELQSHFATAWLAASSHAITDPTCFAPQAPTGSARVHAADSASGDRVSSVAILMELAAATSRSELLVTTPYFSPTDGILRELEAAARRGVAVRILVPGEHTDSRAVRHAGHHDYGPLLEAGVRIFEHQKTMVHQKIVVVDRQWSHVGSTNLDLRSLQMSEELSVGILDESIASQLAASFESDLAHAKEVTLASLEDVSIVHRAGDWLCSLGSGQL